MKHIVTFENFVNENYEKTEEGVWNTLFGDKPVTLEQAKKIIEQDVTKSKVYHSWLERDPEAAELYVEFISKNPKVVFAAFDQNTRQWRDTGKYKAAVGETES